MRTFATDTMGFIRTPRVAEPGTVVPLGQQRRDGLVTGVSLGPQLLIPANEETSNFIDPRHDLRMSRLDRAATFMELRQSRKAAAESDSASSETSGATSSDSATDSSASEPSPSAPGASGGAK